MPIWVMGFRPGWHSVYFVGVILDVSMHVDTIRRCRRGYLFQMSRNTSGKVAVIPDAADLSQKASRVPVPLHAGRAMCAEKGA